MKFKVGTLLLASTLLCHCGSDDHSGGSWEDAPKEESTEPAKTATSNLEKKDEPTNKTLGPATTAAASTPAHQEAAPAAPETQAPSTTAKPSKLIRKLDANEVFPGWILRGVTEERVPWKATITAANSETITVTIESSDLKATTSKRVPKVPDTMTGLSKYELFEGGWVEDLTITVTRDEKTGTCQLIYFRNGITNTESNLLGECF